MKAIKPFSLFGFALISIALAVSGCSQKSYPAAELKEALTEICRKEYGIDNVDVKFAGSTIGVYLPLKKLFATDFKGSVIAGKVRNLETLFEPSPEALEKVEDVLFSISRVLLSTDREIQFYVLQATDVENTGLQLVLKGHVDDVKRVRVWDIPRSEYRKRVIHEMRQNRAVLWHAPVRKLLNDLSDKPIDEVMPQYFGPTISEETVKTLFYNDAFTKPGAETPIRWDVINMRSARVQRGEVLVYVNARPHRDFKPVLPEGKTAQFLFLVSLKGPEPQILRIIPFQYLDDSGKLQHIPFPQDIQIEQSLENWEEEFPVEEIHMGEFLAEQLTRRIQLMVAQDERIQNTFREVKVMVRYDRESPTPHYTFEFESVALKDMDPYSPDSLILHEDMLYLLNMISREFVEVLRSYHFGDYEYLSVDISQEAGEHIIGRDDLELFRKRKLDFQGLLGPSTI